MKNRSLRGIIRIRKRGVSLSPRRLFKNDDGVFLNLKSIRRIIRFRQAVRALMQVRHIEIPHRQFGRDFCEICVHIPYISVAEIIDFVIRKDLGRFKIGRGANKRGGRKADQCQTKGEASKPMFSFFLVFFFIFFSFLNKIFSASRLEFKFFPTRRRASPPPLRKAVQAVPAQSNLFVSHTSCRKNTAKPLRRA